jgi:predicted SAM-dependent methyltransferase
VEGWLNVDANILTSRPDLWINLLHGMPFRDNSVSVFYSHHVLEHLPEGRLPGFLAELFRCLEPGGGIRLGVPHAGNAYRMYAAGRDDWFEDFPHPRKSLGGRCANFLLCANEHFALLDFSFLNELLTDAGFVHVKECMPIKESILVGQEVLSLEYEFDFETPHTLIVEARKS